ncbi:MAG: TPM domain-containing protein [Candidatus Acidiferrales bacterium]
MRAAFRHYLAGVSLLGLTLLGAVSVPGQMLPPRPGPRDFIVDEANLIEAQDSEQIKTICDQLLTERRVPIVVVTVPSLAKYGAMDIESYALAMFNTWGIGSKDYNYGILLLVSLGDRKARIELGAAYAGSKDETAQMIMQDIMMPSFKRGDYSTGILQGVQALDSMARGLPVRAPGQWWHFWAFLGAIALGIGVAISLILSGRKGWGWGLLAFIFVVIIGVLLAAARGGGGGGSAFGGGRGGGGGATGSW